MEIIKQGYLVKRGHVVHNWKARWFMLDGESLTYYTCKGEVSSKGSIPLKDCQVVSPCLDYSKRPTVFKVVNKKQELVMQASSLEERDAWVLDLRSAARCLQEGRPFTRSSLRQSIRLEHSLNLREILAKMKDPESGIKSESFNSSNKLYKDCFTGACVVNWLVSSEVVRTRAEGLLACLALLDDGYVRPTGDRAKSAAHSNSQFLDDTEALYCFIDSRHGAQDTDSDDECSILREEFRGRIIKQGCLLKQGHKRLNWKIRKFVLREEPAYLHYYDPTKEDSRYPLGGFALKNSIISAMGEDGLPPGGDKVQGNLIHIITPEDVHYYLQASTSAERQQWIEAIKRLC
ncbi:pleckstrin-like [Petromyzon marinus]|uniref:pleckstrin-like n=1 Tax=Petromyzon marinus TaxID=7757 RepID=UPI003F70B6E4